MHAIGRQKECIHLLDITSHGPAFITFQGSCEWTNLPIPLMHLLLHNHKIVHIHIFPLCFHIWCLLCLIRCLGFH
uniref:Uncharacterized protein n=1 Tax=Leersia perrieri TaxID=77586 RepID=A0A0D9VPQ6_9ORYZ